MDKGWSSSDKEGARTYSTYAYPSIQPLGEKTHGLDVYAHFYHQLISAGNIVGAISSNQYTITKVAHGARKGDLIRFKSGAGAAREIKVIHVVDADNFDLAEKASEIVAGNTYDLMRPTQPAVDSDGLLQVAIAAGDVAFQRNGVSTAVTEDTAVIANNRALPTKTINDVSETIVVDYGVTTITTAAWTQLLAATAQKTIKLQIFDSSGQLLELGTGAVAAEARKLLITPGGNGTIEVQIAAGTRLSARAISADATGAGSYLAINLIRE